MHEKKGFAFKVLVGILLGLVLGTLMMQNMPVGIQPGDTLEVSSSNGLVMEVIVPDGKDAAPVNIDGTDTTDSFALAGLHGQAALDGLSDATGQPVTEMITVDRKGVTVKPPATEVVYVLGQVFLRLLKMLVVPLIIATVLVGIASLGNIKKLGKIGSMTAFWYVGTMLVATAIGLTYVNVLQPGQAAAKIWGDEAGSAAIASQTPADLILRIIPTNPIQAIAELDVVGMLFFVIIFAFAMLAMGKRRTAPVFNFFESLNDIIFVLIGWVMSLAPYGVSFLIAHTMATQDVGFLKQIGQSLGLFALTVVLALVTHWIFLLVMVGIFGKMNPFKFIQKLGPAMSVAFGTNSSSATLPVTMRCIDDMKVSKRIRNFVIPVGATLNMDGTALFEATAVLFFAQAFAVHLDVGAQALVAFTSVAAAMGAAGIPSAGLVTMTIVLSAVGLPDSKISLLWAIDRPLDMLRTTVNITGDAATCRIVQSFNPDIRPEDDDVAEEYEPIDPTASHDDPVVIDSE
jgi:Na+/H+-dicarboxylate symporter